MDISCEVKVAGT